MSDRQPNVLVLLSDEHSLGGPSGTGNAHHLPDGRIVDADTPLYRPHVLAEDPGAVFEDFPDG